MLCHFEAFSALSLRQSCILVCLIYRLDLVYVRGKHGRKVPILMTAKIVNGINALLKTRDTVGVYGDNRCLRSTNKKVFKVTPRTRLLPFNCQ